MSARNNTQIKPLVIAVSMALGLAVGGNATAGGDAARNSLHGIVQHTVNTNPEILVQKNEYLSRREEIRQAEAGYYPTVDANAGYGYEYTDSTTTRGNGQNGVELARKELGLSLVQNVFDGHLTTNEVERHRARARATAHQLDGQAEKIGLNAAQVYIDILRYRKLLDLAQENLAVHERIHDQIKLRSESGVGRKADLDQIEARLALAENNIVAARVNVQDAKTAFVKVVGEEPGKLSPVPSIRGQLPSSESDAVSRALNNHPILKSAFADVDAATEQHEAAAYNMYPRLDVELGATHNEDIDGVRGTNEDATAMLRMRWNLYNGGKDMARRRQTAHQINEAKEIRNRTHRQVEESTRLSYAAFKATSTQITLLKRQIASNIKTRDAYVQQFNLNERTLLDVLNTENDLYQSRQDLVKAEMDNLFAQYRVMADLGRLTETLSVVVIDDDDEAPEYAKALGIDPYTDKKYPDNEYMEVTEDHEMEVIDGPEDLEKADVAAKGAKAKAPAAPSENTSISAASVAQKDVEVEAVSDMLAQRLDSATGAGTPEVMGDLGIKDAKAPVPAGPGVAETQEPRVIPASPVVAEQPRANQDPGFWRKLFN
ncbi:MAG: TolC family outer membrane protein [Gammaproteobacteria bacterium]|nr:TolC family outer membrane protein [Gammaproteobacteria bacterium]MBU1656069.1 TolC family outer membrane protein [Gammaproteobacteria bacterium]MBU1960338.1 TolC family outer membrane protein [Gammaproteobacteria bacterium]